MTNILPEDLFLIVYVIVDDWYQTKGKHYLHGKPGVKPEFTDSEMHFVLCDIFGDKGFIGLDWQTQIFDQTGNLLWTPRRSNQKTQNSPALNRFLSSKRERIEGVFHEIQDVGRNIERLLAKTVLGLASRVIARMTSHILRRLLLVDFGINVQTFEVSSVS